MVKVKKNTLIGVLVGIILCIGIFCGVNYLIRYANGDTKAQTEAREEMQKLSEEAEKSMNNNSQWYQDELNKYKNEVR